jgi:hypothetical protein
MGKRPPSGGRTAAAREAKRSVNPPSASNLEADIYPTKHVERLCLRAIVLLSRAKWRLREEMVLNCCPFAIHHAQRNEEQIPAPG